MSEKTVKGYKVFNPDWTCRGFQYKVGESYEMDEEPIACERGYHFCERLEDCFDYYDFDSENKVAEIIAYGEITIENNKCCTNKIKIEKELSWYEVLDIVNIGKSCTGIGNSGSCNAGDYNAGDYNAGDYNVEDYNTGNSNSGICNSGNCNSGSWNTTDYSNGCFNTVQQRIFLFNKLSDWTMKDWRSSKARTILYDMMVSPIQKIDEKDMTDKEKEEHPEYQTTGFYLKKLSLEEIAEERQKCWNELSQEQKDIVMAIPNFDKEIFKETTGIDVDMEE